MLSGVSASAFTSYLKTHYIRAGAPATQLAAEVHGFQRALYVGTCFAIAGSLAAIFLVHEKRGQKVAVDPAAMTGV